MKNKIVIITGANSGIGRETARALAAKDATVIMACRDEGRATEALDDIVATSGSKSVEVMPLDLASFASIRQFATDFQNKFAHIDVLLNNAGLVPFKKQITVDGFEMQFGVNHLGHFLLTKLLLPQLNAAGNARVINVASMMHHLGKIDFDSFRGETSYRPIRAYCQSKLANVLFTREFAKRHTDDDITAYCLHPGGVGTNIFGRSYFRRTLYKMLGGFLSPARGAKTSTYLAAETDIEKYDGAYFDEFQHVKPGSKLSNDSALAEKLWQVSEDLIAT
jgi:NAD(P)-dependent dehydrogenase (short-subunit alcohol dehydrogenase family)